MVLERLPVQGAITIQAFIRDVFNGWRVIEILRFEGKATVVKVVVFSKVRFTLHVVIVIILTDHILRGI